MVKGVVFDMDGLMFDTERLAIEGWQFAFDEMGLPIPLELIHAMIGRTLDNALLLLKEQAGEEVDVNLGNRLCGEYMHRALEREGMPVKEGLFELLNYLSARGINRTVATSTGTDRAWEMLKMAGVDGYFKQIVGGDQVERSKPAPDIYLLACKSLSLSPACCMALEDSFNGIRAAHAAGMLPVMVPDVLMPDEEIEGLLYACVKNLREVIPLLEAQA